MNTQSCIAAESTCSALIFGPPLDRICVCNSVPWSQKMPKVIRIYQMIAARQKKSEYTRLHVKRIVEMSHVPLTFGHSGEKNGREESAKDAKSVWTRSF